jgi:hypothetical protein
MDLSDHREYSFISDTTSVTESKVDHASLTPIFSPRVSYNPVTRGGSITIVTNELYAVI